jgi:hypothetical protein
MRLMREAFLLTSAHKATLDPWIQRALKEFNPQMRPKMWDRLRTYQLCVMTAQDRAPQLLIRSVLQVTLPRRMTRPINYEAWRVFPFPQ